MEEKKELKTFKDLMFESILPKVELISIILIIVSILFKILKLQGTPSIFMISLSTYAGVCYISSFEKTELQGWFNNLLTKIGGISSAILVIGLLFLTLNLPGASDMLMIGTPIFCLSFILVFIKFLNSESKVYKKILIRHSKTLAIVIAIYFVSIYLSN